jgi:hypothetical protein
MSKTLVYRLFGIGKLPADLVAEFQSEGIIFSDEGIRGTVTYKNFRGGGRYANWKRQWYSSSIVLTNKRLIAFRLRRRIIDISLDDPRLDQMEFSVEEPETFVAAFDAGLFQKDWSGRIEYRFRSPISKPLLERLRPGNKV